MCLILQRSCLLYASLEPYPGLEPGTPAWKAEMLTTTPIGQMLEPHVGFEPATFSMARRRATTAPMGQIFSGGGRTRTHKRFLGRGGFQVRCLTN